MSVNKLLTFVNHNCDRRKEDNSSLDESDKSIVFIKLTSLTKTKFANIPFWGEVMATKNIAFDWKMFVSSNSIGVGPSWF